MRGSFRLEPVVTWLIQSILVGINFREFIGSQSCFTHGHIEGMKMHLPLRKEKRTGMREDGHRERYLNRLVICQDKNVSSYYQ